jgi:hypothetical protein
MSYSLDIDKLEDKCRSLIIIFVITIKIRNKFIFPIRVESPDAS